MPRKRITQRKIRGGKAMSSGGDMVTNHAARNCITELEEALAEKTLAIRDRDELIEDLKSDLRLLHQEIQNSITWK